MLLSFHRALEVVTVSILGRGRGGEDEEERPGEAGAGPHVVCPLWCHCLHCPCVPIPGTKDAITAAKWPAKQVPDTAVDM